LNFLFIKNRKLPTVTISNLILPEYLEELVYTNSTNLLDESSFREYVKKISYYKLLETQSFLKKLNKNYTIQQLKELKVLGIYGKRLTNISTLYLPKLENLDLPGQLFNFPNLRWMIHPPNLKKLYLDCNFITTIPDLTAFYNLETLRLSTNRLSGKLELKHPNLQYLNLSNNQLTEVNFDLPNLEELGLCENRLTKVKLDLPKLKGLSICENRLVEFPELNTPNIKELEIWHNNIHSIPELNFQNLEDINISINPLETISKFNFPKLNSFTAEDTQLDEKSKKYLESLNIPYLHL